MTTRKIITRSQRNEPVVEKDFRFTQDMAPEVFGDERIFGFIREYRQNAWENYVSLPLPVTSEEAWRRTDIRGLEVEQFSIPELGAYRGLVQTPPDLLKPLAGENHGGQIVLLPGGGSADLDPGLSSSGLVFTDLRTAETYYPKILEKILGKIVSSSESKFAAMTGALAQAGVLLYVPAGMQVEQPLHSILWGPGKGLAYFSHVMIYVEDGASVTYVHEAASPNETGGQTLHAGIVEIYVGRGANLRFVELQSWGEHVWNFSHERARVEQDGNLDWIFGAVGSHLTKNFSTLDLVGKGSTGRMSGFYFTDGIQHLDHDTQQNHHAPHTTSDLLFKGALKDQSRSVWQGMIYVAPGAQKTDGYQSNRNLILSPKARADSIPGLEIMADDVRCTHGATIGKIDADQVFYLRSRGISYHDAERLIVEGFFDPIMQRIPFEGVRSRFQQAILEKMK